MVFALQLAHTAALIAARFDRLDVLHFLVKHYNVSLTASKTSRVCLMCMDVGVFWEGRCVDHLSPSALSVPFAAAAGDSISVLKHLNTIGFDVNERAEVRLNPENLRRIRF